MEEEHNLTTNKSFYQLEGNYSSSASEDPPVFLIVLMILFASWVTLVNALVLVCVSTNMNTLENFISIQILGFSVTDMFVGLSAFPLILTFQLTTAFPYFETCAVILGGYATFQTANLFHSFGICIQRVLTIKRRTLTRDTHIRHARTTLFLQMLCVCMLSAIVVAVPFLSFGKFGKKTNECSFIAMFEDKHIIATGIFNVIFLIPQVGMTVSYIYMMWYLLKKWRRINIRRVQSEIPINLVGPSTSHSTTTTTKSSEKTSTNQGISSSNKVPTNYNQVAKDTIISIQHDDPKGTKHGGTNTDQNSQMGLTDDITQADNESCSRRVKLATEAENIRFTSSEQFTVLVSNTAGEVHYKRQKDVLITIGLILLVVNIFMTPLNIIVLIDLIDFNLLGRNIKFGLFTFSFMNSALNPFIYSLRIKPFKNAIRGKLVRFVSLVFRCR